MNNQRMWMLCALSALMTAAGCGTPGSGSGGSTSSSTTTVSTGGAGGTTSTSKTTASTGGMGTGGTSTGGAGGTGGTAPACDGGKTCTGMGDCPVPATKCVTATCNSGCCGTTNAPKTQTCTDNGSICDGNGKCVQCNVPDDCTATGTMCVSNTCNGNTCGTSNAAQDSSCNDHGGVVCNNAGKCVSALCTDGVVDGNETDKDCGGAPFMGDPACPRCADHLKCLMGSDCADGVCDPSTHTCSPPTCSDGVKNGTETDVDCGGSCDAMGKTCADLKHCKAAADCTNGDCFGVPNGTCVSCMDGVKDGNETGPDCGGVDCDNLPVPKLCAKGVGCFMGGDCQTQLCNSSFVCDTKGDGAQCGSAVECTDMSCLTPQGGGNTICCHTACATQPASSCGTDGTCLTTGAGCAFYQNTTVCGGTCSNGVVTAAGHCNGSGACNGGTSTCGGNLGCNGGGCATSCTPNTTTGCATGHTCNAGGTACI